MKTALLDVKGFLHACGQLEKRDPDLYWRLCREEYKELFDAILANDEVETLDAILDLIWVLLGLGLSMDLPIVEGWNEVANSNFAKIDPVSGRVLKRDDGKVQKPEGWKPPDLATILKKYKYGNQD